MKKLSCLSVIAAALSLAGCHHSLYHTSGNRINHTRRQMDQMQQSAKQTQAVIVHHTGFYADIEPLALAHNPLWMQEPISLHAESLPFRSLLATILGKHSVSVSLNESIQANMPISMRYEGTVGGAIKTLAHLSDYHCSWSAANQLDWSAFETKSFDISFMPGNSSYLVGQQANGNHRAQASSENSSSHSPLSQINDEQYSNLRASLSVWDDLKAALNRMKSPDAQVSLSEATTSLSVTDRPSHVRSIEQYVQHMNEYLSREVMVRVQVLEVRLNEDFNYGVNWNAVAHMLGSSFSLKGSLADATNLTSNSLVLSSATQQPQLGIGSASQTFINALDQQGDVRVVTQPQVITLNNQMASIRITKNIGYIESVSQTQNEVGNFNTSSVVPGTVTDGFTLYVLPKIHGDEVFLQVSSTIANLERLDKTSTQPTGVSVSSSSSQQYQAIQLPTLSQKSFNERSVVRSGSTLIMAGYKRLEDQTNQAKMFGLKELGGQGAVRKDVETLVLITPVILRGASQHVHAHS